MRVNHPLAQRLSLLFVAVLVVSGVLLPGYVRAQTAACAATVSVQPGDTLSTIAAANLGNPQAYPRIVAATNAAAALNPAYATIADPNVIAVGWQLCIPGASAVPETAAAPEGGGLAALVSPLATPVAGDAANNAEGESALAALDARMGPDGVNPLTIEYLLKQVYPGSPVVVEQTLAAGSNYSRYLVSYRSEGLKIIAYMTVPTGPKPATGWPVIIFNHGYIPPEVYRPTERYIAYQDAFARNGYIVFRPDYRGHADSEGEADGAYGDPGYTIDVLNAVSSVKQLPDADPDRIGMWGHSLGGFITLRAMVTRGDIKAGVIWAGVVGSYPEMLENWRRRPNAVPTTIPTRARRWRTELVERYGTPAENPEFWASISANTYVEDLSGPLQLHHGTADTSVPIEFSQLLYNEVIAAGGQVEYYTYAGDDHNLAGQFSLAMQRSVAFFDQHVKGE
jgi:fermentation-respiration switch protein FrsA (DUF1100 family)